MFLTILFSLLAMSLWWWRRADARLKLVASPRYLRILLGLFVLSVMFFPLAAARLGHYFPAVLPATGLFWHVFIMPPTMLAVVLIDAAVYAKRRNRPRPAAAPVNLSRRRLLTAAAVAGPPLLSGGLDAVSLAQLGQFRVRRLELAVQGWPAPLSGFAIAIVADVHTGPFSTPAMLAEIVQRTNAIHQGGPADLVVLGGDLINTTLRDMPAALEMATALRGRLGTVAILGNHDVMDSRRRFIAMMEKAGIPLLVDQLMTIEPLAGLRLQLLGVDWRVGDRALYESVAYVAARRDPALFPICLVHHPHAWDEAVRRGLPLVLAGHTHGGQLMLTKDIGAGPLRFRYWAGTHRRDGSTMTISNGVGDWFPLRVNAPAEILNVIVRPALNHPA
jgi:uncharacterized protein